MVVLSNLILLVLHIIFDLFFLPCSRYSKRCIFSTGFLSSIVRSNRLCLPRASPAHCSMLLLMASTMTVYSSSTFFLILPSLIGFGIMYRSERFPFEHEKCYVLRIFSIGRVFAPYVTIGVVSKYFLVISLDFMA